MLYNTLRLFLVIILIPMVSLGEEINFEKKQLQILGKNGKKHELFVEIADTIEKRSNGLMFRNEMPENSGMLFLFDKELEVNMWMKDTYIPLDVIFIKDGGIISKIVSSTTPSSLKSISSLGKVTAVLELNAGICKKLGIKKNDKVVF